MGTWKKSPPELIAAFDAAIAGAAQAERRQMFGYPCAFVNGRMAVGLHEDRVIARVPAQAEQLPCIIMGRRMKDYVAVPMTDALAGGAMTRWVNKAVAFTAALPPKPAKKAKLKKAKLQADEAKAKAKSGRVRGKAPQAL